MADFVSADISKISKFEEDSVEAIAEFNSIKEEFNSINSVLLDKWEGQGSVAYKTETDHILEEIGNIKIVLDEINNSAIKDIKDIYLELDSALGDFNRNPQVEEDGNGGE